MSRAQDIGTHGKVDELPLLRECLSLFFLVVETEEASHGVLANMMRRISLFLSNVER